MRRLITVLALAAAAAVFGVAPAEARAQSPMAIREGPEQKRTFPGIPRFLNTFSSDLTPDQCMQFDFCDNVPLDIYGPSLDEVDEFVVTITLSWPEAGTATNLDMVLFDDKQQTEGAETPTYTRVVDAKHKTNNPESIVVSNADLGRYNLVVMNQQGSNSSYTISAVIGEKDYGPGPFESLDPTRPPSGGDDDDEEDIALPEDTSGDTLPPDTSGFGLPEGPILPDAGGAGDQTFDEFGTPDFEGQLGGRPPMPAGALRPTRKNVPPASAAVVLAWLGFVPLSLGAGAGFFVYRRARTSRLFS